MKDELLAAILNLDDKLDKLTVVQTEIRSDLNYHIKRTDILEAELKPVKDHVNRVTFAFTAIKYISGITGIGALIKFIKGIQ